MMEHRANSDASIEDYLFGRLDEDGMKAFEAALGADPALRAELAFARQVKEAAAVNDAPASAELGWARLNRAIDTETATASAAVARSRRLSVWQTAGIAASFAILCSFATAYFTGGAEPDLYQTATEAPAGAHAKIVFQTDARVEDINALLSRLDADIIAGPSAIGVYDVRFDRDEEIAAAIADIKAQAQLVEMIAAVDPIED
ncbi:MAG: hypothetical protein AAFW81_09885 [Pseudomonadota bacterium]